MTTEEIKNMVQQYFDGELEKNKEPLMFSLLSENVEAREFFKQLNIVKNATNEIIEEFPAELEQRIMYSLDRKKEKRLPVFFRSSFIPAFSYAVAVILVIVSIILFTELKEYKSEIKIISQQVKMQNQTIELILNNSLPPAEIKDKQGSDIIIKANL